MGIYGANGELSVKKDIEYFVDLYDALEGVLRKIPLFFGVISFVLAAVIFVFA